PTGWGHSQRIIDYRQHSLEIPIDIVVPEAQHRKPKPGEVMIAFHIALCMRVKIVLTAVDLDDEKMFEADEVDDEILKRGRATEGESRAPPRSKVNPHFPLLRGLSPAQSACDLIGHARPPPRPASAAPPPPPGEELIIRLALRSPAPPNPSAELA